MLTSETISAHLPPKSTTTVDAIALFDSLEPVDLAFMLGRWQGLGLHTGHPLDGLLEVANWYGKEFVTPECVHPLLFLDSDRNLFKMSPHPQLAKLTWHLPLFQKNLLKNEFFKPLFTRLSPLLKTEESQARLRMMEHRGKISATMIYDYLPIHDAFRKIDDNTLLGLMDYKESARPFFFTLKREILRRE